MVSEASREKARVSGEDVKGAPRTRVAFRVLLSRDFSRPDSPKWRACSQVTITVSNMVAMIFYFSTLFCNSLCIDCEIPKPVNTRNTWERYGDARKKPLSCEKVKPHEATIISLWFCGSLSCPDLCSV